MFLGAGKSRMAFKYLGSGYTVDSEMRKPAKSTDRLAN